MRRASRALAPVVAAVLGAGLPAGCDSRGAPPVAAAEPELSATAVYGRHAAVRGKVDVRIANEGPAEVVVDSYQVRHPLFEVVAADPRRSRLPADGRARIVPVSFGEPRCDADGGPAPVVVVGVRDGERVREVAVPLADGEPGLERAHRLTCAAAQVAGTVELDLAAGELADDLVLRTALQLRRRAEGEVVVTELGGNILFSVDLPPARPLVVLAPGASEAQVEVQVRATRCDPHALTESKRSFVLPAFVSVAGGEPAQVQVAVSAPAREALQQLLDRTCGPPA